MRLYHDSRNENYRFPTGAATCGGVVRLSLFIEGHSNVDYARVHLLQNDEKRTVEMCHAETYHDGVLYSAEITLPEEPCLLWYHFEASAEGTQMFFFNNPAGLGGAGICADTDDGKNYQITVYKGDFKTPDWFKKGVMYQIFPDRFYRSEPSSSIGEKCTEYRLHKTWNEGYFYDRHPFENGPACNDFYGGTLKGIEEKLDYLAELGISVIYLNPIFEAFSNHRYDTGNYEKIDPILGSEEDFASLCKAAKERGISIILDGVFSHTGSDSKYFNKYGSYGENVGAAKDDASPYKDWYQWTSDGGYESWWGCSNLPNVCETNPTYLDYILRDKNAIIKKWLRLGASGWRLDVADELPDEFIKILRREVKSCKKDALIIGEVWEDASNKISYGCRREYLFGDELDSVMNYPFKDGVIAFLNGWISPLDFGEKMLSIIENYPKEVLYANMNLIGTHDTARAKTVLAGLNTDGVPSWEAEGFRLSKEHEALATARLRLAAFMQMTFVGVPCVYYGDEIGMQGLRDPHNRRPYNWENGDTGLREYYKNIIALRNSLGCLKSGDFRLLYAKGDVLVYMRRIEGGKDVFGKRAKNSTAVCCINRGRDWQNVRINIPDGADRDLKGFFKDGVIKKGEDSFELTLEPFGAEIFAG